MRDNKRLYAVRNEAGNLALYSPSTGRWSWTDSTPTTSTLKTLVQRWQGEVGGTVVEFVESCGIDWQMEAEKLRGEETRLTADLKVLERALELACTYANAKGVLFTEQVVRTPAEFKEMACKEEKDEQD